jgi:hypothetical protein
MDFWVNKSPQHDVEGIHSSYPEEKALIDSAAAAAYIRLAIKDVELFHHLVCQGSSKVYVHSFFQ